MNDQTTSSIQFPFPVEDTQAPPAHPPASIEETSTTEAQETAALALPPTPSTPPTDPPCVSLTTQEGEPQDAPAEPDGLPEELHTITINQAVRLMNVSRTTFFYLRQTGQIGPREIPFGKRIRFNRNEFLAWMAAGNPKASEWQAFTQKRNQQ